MTQVNKKAAFPHYVQGAGEHEPEYAPGLSKREYFAIKIAAGIAANSIPGDHHMPKELVRQSLEIADLLLAKLSQSDSEGRKDTNDKG